MRVLLIGEPAQQVLCKELTQYGHEILPAPQGRPPIQCVSDLRPDVVVMGSTLSEPEPQAVFKEIRKVSEVPIITLIGVGSALDVVGWLEFGADDALTSPVNGRELAARIGAVVRRRATVQRLIQEDRELLTKIDELVQNVEEKARISFMELQSSMLTAGNGQVDGNHVLEYGPFRLHPSSGTGYIHETEINLSRAETRLLSVFLTRPQQVCTRTELIDALWGEYSSDNISKLEYVVRQLREKVEVDPGAPRYIVAIPGIGYQLG